MNKRIDIIGRRYGRLIVLKYAFTNKWRKAQWLCRCDCANEKIICGKSLRSGHTKSCGCLQKEVGYTNITHGETKNGYTTKEYKCWQHLKERCYNSNSKYYYNYGGRGIIICNRWLESFKNFLEDIGKAPTPKHSIDRINNNGNYEPDNCRWATAKEQNSNTRRNIMIGNLCLKEYCQQHNLNYNTIRARLHHNWPIDKALHTPIRKIK